MTKAMMAKPAATRAVARPLRVLVPLIKEDLESAATAGLPYYIAAGEKLLEAKTSGQVSDGSWGRWLNSNFHLKRTQAFRYMKVATSAREAREQGVPYQGTSIRDITGEREQSRERRTRERGMRQAIADVDVAAVAQDRQTHADEVELHRALALEMIDIGFKALATRLHPDRPGGSRAAMARANRVREELKQVAATRRFV